MPNVEIKGEIENVMVHRSIKEKKRTNEKHVIQPNSLVSYKKFLKLYGNIVTI